MKRGRSNDGRGNGFFESSSKSKSDNSLLTDYVDRETLARALGLNPRTLQRYEGERDGLPSCEIGGRVHYHQEKAVRWIIERGTRRRNQRSRNPVRRER